MALAPPHVLYRDEHLVVLSKPPGLLSVPGIGPQNRDCLVTRVATMLGGYPAGAPLHDPCVIAWLLRPELFTGRAARVTVEFADEATMGRTVVDWDAPPNATVIEHVDADGLFALLTECLGRL